MAGVSLRLRGLFGSRSVLEQAVGYAYAGIAMAGPGLLTSAVLIALDGISIPGLAPAERKAFQVLVLYAYCGSMLLTGGLQLVAARSASDQIYSGEIRRLVPTYAFTSLVSLLLHGVAAGAFVLWTRPPLLLAAAEVCFFGTLGLLWTGMVFLGTLRSFLFVLGAFAAGMVTSLLAAPVLGARYGTAGLLAAFAAGQGLIAALFTARLRVEFPADRAFDPGPLKTLAAHPSLFFVGLAVAAGAWVDKVILWSSPYAVRWESGLRSFPLYDNAVFMAYLTMLPSLALLFIRIEVSFHEKCSRFYGALRRGADLAAIRLRKAEIVESFEESLRRLVVLQGTLTLAAVLFAPRLLEWFHFDWLQYYVFRLACLGAFLQVLVLGLLLMMLQLGLYRLALGMTLLYAGAGAAGTLVALAQGLEFTGYGYVAAGLAALAGAYPVFRRRLVELDRRTLMV